MILFKNYVDLEDPRTTWSHFYAVLSLMNNLLIHFKLNFPDSYSESNKSILTNNYGFKLFPSFAPIFELFIFCILKSSVMKDHS